jgi:predicted lipase
MASLSKKLIMDLVRLSSVCYKPDKNIDISYLYQRPYNKLETTCVFNDIKKKPILYKSESDCEVMVCTHTTGVLIVTFRGTESRGDILTDLNITRERLPLSHIPDTLYPLIHSGFAEQFFSVNHTLEDSIKENDSIIFCGHSLGGALATIGSLYYSFKYPSKNISCVTFGSPRVGDERFAVYFDERVKYSLRYVNDNDPVPCVPTRWRFKHVKGLQWINQDEIEKEIHVWRFYRFLKNTMLSFIGIGYNACDDHKCDNYITDLRAIWKDDL